MSVIEWEGIFQQSNFLNVESTNGQMTLMSFKGMIKDEGLINTINIIKNGHKKKEHRDVQEYAHFFYKNRKKFKIYCHL